MDMITPGVPVKLFDDDSGSVPKNSTVYALPLAMAKLITWQYTFASAPSAVSLALQMSNDNSVWTDLDTGTATAGETKNAAVTAAAFIRARIVSQTGGGNQTVTVILGY